MAVFQMFDMRPWFHPGPCWGSNSAPPAPVAGFTGAYF